METVKSFLPWTRVQARCGDSGREKHCFVFKVILVDKGFPETAAPTGLIMEGFLGEGGTELSSEA